MDRIYGLPYTRRPHPIYGDEAIPAFETVKDSVTIMRGCFGGCTFCSITAHQGRIIQSRSQESVLGELKAMGQDPAFKGVVSDIGGPTANMYQMRCTKPEVEAKCKRLSCVHPKICKLLGHRPRPARRADEGEPRGPGRPQGAGRLGHPDGPRPALARVHGASWPRTTSAATSRSPPSTPTRTSSRRMKKPDIDDFGGFAEPSTKASDDGRQAEAVPRPLLHRLAPRQRPGRDDRPGPLPQAERLPARPGAGLHPGAVRHRHVHVLHGHRPVHGRRGLHRQGPAATASCSGPCCSSSSRRTTSRSARPCSKAGRQDLIGSGCDALIPPTRPRSPYGRGWRRRTSRWARGSTSTRSRPRRRRPGYRPDRKTAKRRPR